MGFDDRDSSIRTRWGSLECTHGLLHHWDYETPPISRLVYIMCDMAGNIYVTQEFHTREGIEGHPTLSQRPATQD
jgi:hypothetical protein